MKRKNGGGKKGKEKKIGDKRKNGEQERKENRKNGETGRKGKKRKETGEAEKRSVVKKIIRNVRR